MPWYFIKLKIDNHTETRRNFMFTTFIVSFFLFITHKGIFSKIHFSLNGLSYTLVIYIYNNLLFKFLRKFMISNYTFSNSNFFIIFSFDFFRIFFFIFFYFFFQNIFLKIENYVWNYFFNLYIYFLSIYLYIY